MRIHFIGIGGIGVSALAKYYLKKGHQVSGSDLVASEITDALKEKGAKLLIGEHKAKNLPKNVDLVVYSPAVPTDNLELKEARELRIRNYELRILSYPEALGELTKKYFTIAISGTHGKSTTTAMVALILIKAGLDPIVIIGTKLKEFGDSNCRVGKSKYLVIEADEHMASFLNYWPKILVLTNIEKDHLDYYKNLNNILKTFKEYIGHLPKEGILIINEDDNNILKLKAQILKLQLKTQNYTLKQPEAKKLKKILKVPGEHNVYNALVAITAARALKIPDKISFQALSEYRGAWRRFETKQLTINNQQLTIISDYAHHPTKVRVTLKAAREKYARKKIWCVYQPHQYQRTYYLFKDFVKVFRQALQPVQGRSLVDKLIITDIFDVAGREISGIKKKVSSEKLVKAINKKNAIYLPKDKILNYLKKNLGSGLARRSFSGGGEVVIIMGAGDIYKLSEKFKVKGRIINYPPTSERGRENPSVLPCRKILKTEGF